MVPKVSVIVPNYNHARFLKRRIDSILSQDYQDFELIILDDCSTDNSRDVILSYKNNSHVSHIIFNEHNSGTAFKQWNKGVSMAVGEYIWIAESDDWAKKDFLSTIIPELEKHPECGLAYTLAHYMKEDVEQWSLNSTGKINVWSGQDFVKKMLAFGCCIYNVSMVVFRKNIFNKLDQSVYANMHLCGDWFFYTQVCLHSGIIQIDSPHSYYRMHTSNVHNKAEQEGLTFLEGIHVLEYMKQHFAIQEKDIARYWGREFVKYRKKYKILNNSVNEIKRYMKNKHIRMYIWYYVYKVRKLFI